MKPLLAMSVCLSAALVGVGQGRPLRVVHSTASHAKLFADYQDTLAAADRGYTVGLSFVALQDKPPSVLEEYQRVVRGWIPHLSFERWSNTKAPVEVPGSSGLLWAIDLRSYRWSLEAWAAVAERDPYCQTPRIDEATAVDRAQAHRPGPRRTRPKRLRGAIGYEVPKRLADKDAFPVVAMVRADWLFRETIETDRSPSYYDLLYAQFRFRGSGVEEFEYDAKEEFYHPGGVTSRTSDGKPRDLPAGQYWRVVKKKGERKVAGGFVDFPRDEDDWNKAFGIDVQQKYLDETAKVNIEVGAIVPGGRDFPDGSIVRHHTGLIIHHKTVFGWAGKTFDFEAKNQYDPLDQAPELFLEATLTGALGKVPADAHEYLASTPNGALAGMLTNAQKKRIEVGGSGVVGHSRDKRFRDVRTVMGCVQCHTEEAGFIYPRNLAEDLSADGVDTKVKRKRVAQKYRDVLLQWEDETYAYRKRYERLIRESTADPHRGGDGLRPAEFARLFTKFRDWYDRPVSLAQASREMGLGTVEFTAFAALASQRSWLNWVVLPNGRAIPRRLWEQKLYREADLLYVGNRDRAPALIEVRPLELKHGDSKFRIGP